MTQTVRPLDLRMSDRSTARTWSGLAQWASGIGRALRCLPSVWDFVALPVLGGFFLLSIVWHGRRSEMIPGFWPRFSGAVPRLADRRPVVWFHAVSVGEALLCRPVLQRLTAERPDLQFALSVSTPDGYAVAHTQIPEAAVFWAPWDFSSAVRRVFDELQPRLMVIAENDFWPQMLAEARRRAVPLAIFNTRMSRREQIEHRWNAWMLRGGLERAAWWGAVSDADANWIRRFFRPTVPVEVTGSLKFAGTLRHRRDAAAGRLRARLGFAPSDVVLVAGSTHAPEEQLLAAVVQDLSTEFPQLRLVLVPRHPSSGPQVAGMLQSSGALFQRRSDLSESATPADRITLIEATGLLRDLWTISDLAFVGGSLAPRGGQNLAEPAGCGVPMCFGPHLENFQEMAGQFLTAGAAVQVGSRNELRACLHGWLRDPGEAARIGTAAQQLVAGQTAPLEQTVRGLLSVLPGPDELCLPHFLPPVGEEGP